MTLQQQNKIDWGQDDNTVINDNGYEEKERRGSSKLLFLQYNGGKGGGYSITNGSDK